MTRRTTPAPAPAPTHDDSVCAIDDCDRKRWGDDPLCRRHLAQLEQAMTAPEPDPTAPVE